MDYAGFDHVSHPFGVGMHVWGGCMCFDRIRALPFLDYDKGVRTKLCLGRSECRKINKRNVLDTTLFGVHRRYVRPDSWTMVLRLPGFAVI